MKTTMESLEYGGRKVISYADTPGLPEQLAFISLQEDIMVFGNTGAFSVRDIIDAAKVNTEQKGRIVIEQSGMIWTIYVIDMNGAITNKGKARIEVTDVERYHEVLKQNRSTNLKQPDTLIGKVVANVNGVTVADDGNNGQMY